jgi:hypothetical protein
MDIAAGRRHFKAMPCLGTIARCWMTGEGAPTAIGGPKAPTHALKRPGRTRADQFENVSQDLMSPLFKPAVSHCWRCAAEPWVKLSGTA